MIGKPKPLSDDKRKDLIDKLYLDRLLEKSVPHTRKGLSNLRILGVDEVGVTERIGSVFIGFYVETNGERVRGVKDSKSLSNAKIHNLYNNIKGTQWIKRIPYEGIFSYQGMRSQITAAITEEVCNIPSDLYDVIVVDGKMVINQSKFPKPILVIEKADSKIYEVAVASIVARKKFLDEREEIRKYFSEMYPELTFDKLTEVAIHYFERLVGFSKYHRPAVVMKGTIGYLLNLMQCDKIALLRYIRFRFFDGKMPTRAQFDESLRDIYYFVSNYLCNLHRNNVIYSYGKVAIYEYKNVMVIKMPYVGLDRREVVRNIIIRLRREKKIEDQGTDTEQASGDRGEYRELKLEESWAPVLLNQSYELD